MDDDRMDRLTELFERALDLPRAARGGFVLDACGDDDALRTELLSLLEAHDASSELFDELAADLVAPGYAALLGSRPPASSAALRAELEAALRSSYRIERELGGGGMSRVFLAEEIGLGRTVVIKVLDGDTAMSGERFRREIRLAAQLQHPHIVPLLASGSTGRLLYYTMPYVAGESLRSRIARDGALPVRDALAIWRDVLDALAHAHASGVVHRDVKPGNILLSGRNALVTDFGIARAVEAAAGSADATTIGVTIGTPAYMAPEQLTGEHTPDHRSDLYAAGLVLHEMLEGRLPFPHGSPAELLRARLAATPPALTRHDCPPELAALLQRCLAPDPAQRPASADELIAALDTIPREPALRQRRALPVYALAALALLILIAAAIAVARPGTGPEAAPEPAAIRIAVMPLTPVDGEAGDAALARGLTEELIAMLGRTRGLHVIGSTSVDALRARQLTVAQIADSLRVTHLIEGSLQSADGRVRMQLRLIDARGGATRWAETYNREISDIFAVQDDIARAVAGELNVLLAPTGRRSEHRYTPDIAAYEWYLRGRSTTLLRTAEGRRQGIEHLDRAIAADSGFAAAWAALVWLYLSEAGSEPGDYMLWQERAERAARRALQLDGSLPDAHAALGWALLLRRDWTGAEASLKRAIALDPVVHRGHEGLARLYMVTRRPAEQLAAARRGLEDDPYSHAAMRELALALNVNGRCDETIELLRPLKSLTPPAAVAGVIMGQCYITKQQWPEAIAEFRWSMELGARAALAFLAYAHARSGDTAQARAVLDDLLAGRQRSHDAFGIAVVYAGLRDYDNAFRWLERAVEEHSWRVYIFDPMFAELHRDPRFAQLRAFGER
jgi:eukaryotic-like serine/threonine-protein kinase